MRDAGPGHTFAFATVVGAILGLLVAGTSTTLAPRIARQVELARQRDVLVAVGLVPAAGRPTSAEISALYRAHVVDDVVQAGSRSLPLFRAVDAAGHTIALCIPIEGPGLWGPIRGLLALDAAAARVVGVVFYEHRETPGLGAAVGSARWTAQWVGKSIVDGDGALIGIAIRKGGIDRTSAWDLAHAIDAISGATITSRAVERLTRAGLERYRPYWEERWAGR